LVIIAANNEEIIEELLINLEKEFANKHNSRLVIICASEYQT